MAIGDEIKKIKDAIKAIANDPDLTVMQKQMIFQDIKIASRTMGQGLMQIQVAETIKPLERKAELLAMVDAVKETPPVDENAPVKPVKPEPAEVGGKDNKNV